MIEQMTSLNSGSAYANSSLTTLQAGVAGNSSDVVNTIQIAVAPGNNLTIMPGTASTQQVGVITNGHNTIPIFQNLPTYTSYKESGLLLEFLLIYNFFMVRSKSVIFHLPVVVNIPRDCYLKNSLAAENGMVLI